MMAQSSEGTMMHASSHWFVSRDILGSVLLGQQILEISERAGGDRPATPVLRPRTSQRDERALEGSRTD